MYVLAFGAKIGTFFEGGTPLGPLKKCGQSEEKNQKIIFEHDPQFLFYNLKVL